jgi:hypothetical protein
MHSWRSSSRRTPIGPAGKAPVGPISCSRVGGDEGTRTPDPRDANAVLSQLSYIPTG